MAVHIQLAALVGGWQGTNRVWLTPDDPVMESKTQAVVTLIARGKFLSLQYTWAVDGNLQEGLLLLSQEAQGGVVRAAWVDSWHNGDTMMICKGVAESDGSVWVKGAYAAPPGPDWGWKISLEPKDAGTFRLAMDNIMPQGAAMLAVEAVYTRMG